MTKRIRAERRCRDCDANIEDLPKGTRRCLDCVLGMMQDADLEPLEPYPGPNTPWQCRCLRCDGEVTPRFRDIVAGGRGCKPCAVAEAADRNRESEEDAVASMRGAGFEPLVPYPGTVLRPWPSRCLTCGEESSPTLNNVRRRGHCCQHCSGRAPDPRDRVEVMRAAGLEPQVPFPGHGKPWPCLCVRCGREVDPYYNSIRMGHGCRWCNWKALDPEVAAAAMRRAALEPLEPCPGALAKWKCRCMKCGREVVTHYCTIQQGHGGCIWCQKSGFRIADSGIVYLAIHRGYDAAKVGIANDPRERLRRHRRDGWEVLLVVHGSGVTVSTVEDAVLDWWRNDLGLPSYLTAAEMPQSGWTETVAASEIDLAATMRRIRTLASAA